MDEEDGMSLALQHLFESGVPFDIADEALLKNRGRVENGELVVGECRYKTFVLPYCTALDRSTAELIEAFTASGGRLFVYYSSPVRIGGGEETKVFSSNIEFSEILAQSALTYTAYSEKLYSTYRRSPNGDFVYIVNRDAAQPHKTGVRVRGMRSAEIFDLLTLTTTPLCVRDETAYVDVKEAGSVILLINASESQETALTAMGIPARKIGEFTPAYRFPKENYITLDKADWSVDNVHYTEPTLVHEVQSELIERRYEGDLYLRYTLNVENPPKTLEIRFDFKVLSVTVNGAEAPLRTEKNVTVADIKKYVQFGENKIVAHTYFYQRPYVYKVLFDEDVTESLTNCLYYDTQLTELYVSGSFFVRAVGCRPYGALYRADEFVLDGKFNAKHTGDTVTGGLPFYRGALEYTLETEVEDGEYEIVLHGRFATFEASVNGEPLTDVTFGKRFRCKLKTGQNTVRAVVYSGNRNAYGPFHLCTPDVSVSPVAYTCQSPYLSADEFDLDGYYFARFGITKIEIRKCKEKVL